MQILNCKLIYNDYNMYQSEKTDFIIDMVIKLKSEGTYTWDWVTGSYVLNHQVLIRWSIG